MSITPLFVLFLLYLSLHACSARRLHAVDNKINKIENKIHFSIKNDTKNGFKKNSVVVLQPKSSSSEESEEHRSIKDESIKESQADDSTQKLEHVVEINHKTVENEKEKTSGAVQTNKAGVSVSWRVTHRKHGEKHPGFNLDYSSPKTHPPSHN